MARIVLLENPIREYDWGSRTAIAELLGRPSPSAAPQAELWMGAHPSAPSEVGLAGARRSLLAWIEESPEELLGPRVQARVRGRLPFLLKVLAADRPLSIQAHPDAAQAREGFARENAAGIPLDAAERCYRDANHKPELLCALTPFWALRGFRAPHEILALAARLAVAELDAAAACLAGARGGRGALRLAARALRPGAGGARATGARRRRARRPSTRMPTSPSNGSRGCSSCTATTSACSRRSSCTPCGSSPARPSTCRRASCTPISRAWASS